MLVNNIWKLDNYQFDIEKELPWAKKTLKRFGEVVEWCENAGGANDTFLPTVGAFLRHYSNNIGLYQKKNTVLVLVSNQPWRTAIIGLLQRMYSPFFKTTIFCGNWTNPSADPGLLPPIEPLNFVNVTINEMRNGARYGYCVPKVNDLRLQNVTGYYFVADDTLFNFWHELPLDKVLNPREVYNIRTFWDPHAILRSYKAFESSYKNDSRIGSSWQQHQEQLQRANPGKNVTDHYLNEPRAILADFFYIPSGTMEYFGNLLKVMMDVEVFVEVAVGKVMDGMNYNKDFSFSYLWGERPLQWEIYNSTIIGVHPIKLGAVHTDLDYRRKYCDTVVKAFSEEVYG